MKPLDVPDLHHIRAASGWLDLGNLKEAELELEKVSPELGSHPDVMETRWQVCAKAKNWDACLEIANTLLEKDPDRVTGWLHRAYAIRRATGGGLHSALEALTPAAARFPEVHLIPFNLACYTCQMDRLQEARDWLARAFAIAKKTGEQKAVRLTALADPDLEPLWNEIRSIGT